MGEVRSALALLLAGVGGCSGERPLDVNETWVLSVSHEVPAGAVLASADLVQLARDRDYAPENPLLPDQVVGRTATERLLPFEYVRPERLGPPIGVVSAGPVDRLPPTDLETNPPYMVILAARELSPGTVITEADLYAVQIFRSYVPDHAFTTPAPVVGRKVTERILENEFVRDERLAP